MDAEREIIYIFSEILSIKGHVIWVSQGQYCHQHTIHMAKSLKQYKHRGWKKKIWVSFCITLGRPIVVKSTPKSQQFYKTEVSYLSLSPMQFGHTPPHSHLGIYTSSYMLLCHLQSILYRYIQFADWERGGRRTLEIYLGPRNAIYHFCPNSLHQNSIIWHLLAVKETGKGCLVCTQEEKKI